MYLHENVMDTQEQLAFMVTLVHDEYVEEVINGHEKGDFDSWLLFIGQLAVEMSVPEPRSQEWPL